MWSKVLLNNSKIEEFLFTLHNIVLHIKLTDYDIDDKYVDFLIQFTIIVVIALISGDINGIKQKRTR